MLELGYDVEAYVATFLMGPSGIPDNVFDILHDSFKNGMEDEAYVQIADKLGIITEYLGPEESVRKIKKFRTLYAELSQVLGIEKE
jgi:tripartite-type tricarboxylate transporter receptor subunit TctC